MVFFDVLMLALALAIDAFIVSFSYGLILKKEMTINSLKIAFATGFGQFAMPILGWYVAKSIHHHVERFDHWIAFFVFLALGLKVIADALDNRESEEKLDKNLDYKTLLMIGIATSIDALVSGSMLFFMQVHVWFAATTIGVITFICSLIGFHSTRFFKKLPSKYLELFAGVVLILIGVKVLYEHTIG